MLTLKLVMRNYIPVLCLVLVLAPYMQALAEKNNQIYRILKRSRIMDLGEFLVFYAGNFIYYYFLFQLKDDTGKDAILHPFYEYKYDPVPKANPKIETPYLRLDQKSGTIR